ncbi:hypothetical protein SAMD00019534_094600 [Acytostelium subglobosum LB1]|uniref:hypothetical protein n=1 Tax=Acytostelium subglobosum LB1 TaxID=1410327 RepID=UPI000644F0F0|nr:hypothetical protein SAMD00019534_094600 [Acytostelium subglobosum LB1]GAM26285.1 hypothetical protein SAMD00019534_094600 [Acytostelium subglobosum LB1]|eukprot:XP_012750839.1 hypothetical protein SAMD00019534_094600 [Acytostelium subglobosum LB1]
MTGASIHLNKFVDNLIDLGDEKAYPSIIANCTINQNTASSSTNLTSYQSLIKNRSPLLVTDTVLDGNINTAYLIGRGVNMTIQRTTITNNLVVKGGLVSGQLSNVVVSNSTMSHNTLVNSVAIDMDGSQVALHNVVIDQNIHANGSNHLIQCTVGSITMNNVVNNGASLINCDERTCSINGDNSDVCKSGRLSGGAIAGIVIGSIVGCAIIVTLVVVLVIKKK